jgi:hypothetical protein
MQKTSWIEIVTGVGVIISLIFVASEIRSNTKAVRGETMHGITDQSLELTLTLLHVPELRKAYVKASAGQVAQLSLEEEEVLTTWYSAVMRVAENRYRQRELGTFEDVVAVGGGAVSYRIPYFKTYWAQRRSTYPADFASFVDTTLIPLVRDSMPRVLQRQ